MFCWVDSQHARVTTNTNRAFLRGVESVSIARSFGMCVGGDGRTRIVGKVSWLRNQKSITSAELTSGLRVSSRVIVYSTDLPLTGAWCV